MKLLKLDARHEDARRVARCLVGSADVDGLKLIAVLSRVFVLENDDISVDPFETYHSIKIPLDTLKFCPFVAMREQVRVNAVRIDGTIVEIGYGYCSIYTADGVADRIPLRNIRLDLGPIERGELEGCEIVEDK